MTKERPENLVDTVSSEQTALLIPTRWGKMLRPHYAYNFWQFPHATHDTFVKYWHMLAVLAVVAFFVMQTGAGVLRWFLGMLHLAPLTYVPNLLILMVFSSLLLNEVFNRRLHFGVLFFLALMALAFTVGVFATPKLAQPLFAAWVLMPFYLGLVAGPIYLQNNKLRTLFLIGLLLLCAGGVIVNNSVSYPWVGQTLEIGGMEVEGAKEWATAGKQRLSGLARSSYDVAGQLLIFAALVAVVTRQGVLRLLIWGITAYAISLSTSKGVFLSLLMVIIAVELIRKQHYLLLRGVFLLGAVWIFLPPLLALMIDWTELARTDIDNPLYGSFIDRMHDMWPRAFALAHEHGWAFLGRGLGGIGSPLAMFESDMANAGDNVFVYFYVTQGIIALPLFVLAWVVLWRLSALVGHPVVDQLLLLAVALIWYGGVSNIVEHAVMALALGVLVRGLAAYCADACIFEPTSTPLSEYAVNENLPQNSLQNN